MARPVIPPSPVLKWVGGKSKLTGEIANVLPGDFGTYYEPFLGGGALFFHLRPERAVLSDLNPKLVQFYRTMASRPHELLHRILDLQQEFNALDVESRKSWYLNLRTSFNSEDSDVLNQSAQFLALNKTCFNGLFRENSRGEFNVPFNQARGQLAFTNRVNFLAAAEALADAEIRNVAFAEVSKTALAGDVVYFDPPYVPLSPTSSFTDYNKAGFGETDQLQLLNLAADLSSRGVHVVLSNSYSPWVIQNYTAAGFEVREVAVHRGISAKSSSRTTVSEALIVAR